MRRVGLIGGHIFRGYDRVEWDRQTALRFLPLVAAEQPAQYDGWALRWLARWIAETGGATIGHAAEVACALADGLSEPLALESVRSEISRAG